jgi:hypothetical protein
MFYTVIKHSRHLKNTREMIFPSCLCLSANQNIGIYDRTCQSLIENFLGFVKEEIVLLF